LIIPVPRSSRPLPRSPKVSKLISKPGTLTTTLPTLRPLWTDWCADAISASGYLRSMTVRQQLGRLAIHVHDDAKPAEILLLRHENAILRRQVKRRCLGRSCRDHRTGRAAVQQPPGFTLNDRRSRVVARNLSDETWGSPRPCRLIKPDPTQRRSSPRDNSNATGLPDAVRHRPEAGRMTDHGPPAPNPYRHQRMTGSSICARMVASRF
jgi:hypothetical protein